MTAVRRLLRILFGILEEISDQNAYRRYLAERGLAHSGETWRRFCDCRLQRKYQRAKCC
jgi:hypothetical protein